MRVGVCPALRATSVTKLEHLTTLSTLVHRAPTVSMPQTLLTRVPLALSEVRLVQPHWQTAHCVQLVFIAQHQI